MMLGMPLLLLATAAAPSPTEHVSMRCANAVAKAVVYARSMEAEARERGKAIGNVAVYDKAMCVQSRKEPGRTFVSFGFSSGLIRTHGRVYIVEPSGAVGSDSGIPCDETPNPEVCN